MATAKSVRVREIPAPYDGWTLKGVLKRLLSLDDEHGLTLNSLAVDATKPETKVATIEFRKIPEVLSDLKKTVALTLDEREDDHGVTKKRFLLFDHSFLGLTTIYSPPSDKHLVDIIAVSGLGGHAFGSFRCRSDGFMWLRDALPDDLQPARVMIYGHDSHLYLSDSFQDLNALGLTFCESILHISRRENIPLILVGHSLGGLIIKKAMIEMHHGKAARNLLDTVLAVFFFGVPHRGMNIEHLLPMARGQANEKFLLSLGPESAVLLQQCEQFEVAVSSRKMTVICYYETLTSPTAQKNSDGEWKMDGPWEKFVDVTSAQHGRRRHADVEFDAFDKTHSDMARFDRDGNEYRRVLGRLRELVATTQDRGSSNSRAAAYWSIPFPQNKNFVGREAELDELRQRLITDEYSRVAIHALGGMGKSSIALQLAYRVREQYPEYSIFWTNATNAQTLEDSYRDIGKMMGIPTIADEKADIFRLVKEHLSSAAVGQWLIIFDNADDESEWFDRTGSRLADRVPNSQSGSVLLTTRNRRVAAKFAPKSVMKVENMSPDTALALLTQRCSRAADDSDAMRLLDVLCYLPLAIVQAAAYMELNTLTTVGEYVSYLGGIDETAVETLSEDFEDDGRYPEQNNPIITTWLVSFDQLQKKHPLAATYMSFMSCIDPTAIPLSLLPPENAKRQSDALAALVSYSFIHAQAPSSGLFDMHRLVHLATRNWLKDNSRFQDCLDGVTVQLEAKLPRLTREDKDRWRSLLSHVGYTIKLHQRWNQTADKLFEWYSECLIFDGKYGDAVWPLVQSVQGREQQRGRLHLDTLESSSMLALTCSRIGRWEDAESLCSKVLKSIIQPEAGRASSIVVSATDTLAWTYLNQGRFEESEKIQRELMGRILKDPFGGYIYSTSSKNSLVMTYMSQGLWDQAHKLQLDILENTKEVLEPDHPERIRAKYGMALIWVGQARWVEAEKLLSEVFETAKQALGPEHPDTLAIRQKLAKVYGHRGRVNEAEEMQSQILEHHIRLYGADDLLALNSREDMAAIYELQGRLEDAEKLHLEVLEKRKEILGEHYSHTLMSKNNLAKLYNKQARFAEAEKLQSEVLDVRTSHLGAEHPKTLRMMDDLAVTYAQQGKWDQAEKLLRQAIESKKTVFGPRHEETCSAVALWQ